MAKLMLHRNLLKNFGKLPVKVQRRVSEWIDIFQKDPHDPSIGLHGLEEMMVDPKVRGGDLPGGYRAIVVSPDRGDTYLLVHIDTHDKAYAWARNKRFEVHESTGIFQVFDVEEIQAAAEKQNGVKPPVDDYPLSSLTDDDFFRIGVPFPLIPAVRAIQTDGSLEALSDYLPPDCRDVLFGIAAGMTIEEALKEMLGLDEETDAGVQGGGDFSKIDRSPNFDLVLVTGEEHLKDILSASMDEWRIFLHPYQKKLVEWKTKGPMNITGAAGTGKTVALMHRAVYLARKIKEPKDQVLFTTFTTNLSVTIKNLIQRLGPEVADRIEVTNLHALARTICLRAGWRGRIAQEEDLEEVWKEVWLDPNIPELPMPEEEMKNEYERVIDANGIDEEEVYLTTVRSGRPRISRRQRRLAWPFFRSFQRGLKKRNLLNLRGGYSPGQAGYRAGELPEIRPCPCGRDPGFQPGGLASDQGTQPH
ncbi:MAG: AAA family ATPase [Deltaproteobacteria bacterium]|nr:AAA family ATPase [Deltaproteobacteria bacterium]